MRKIPTLFARDEETNRRFVKDELTPGCEWVLDGEGTATRKYDGTCVMFDGATWWARREVKGGKAAPENFVEVEHDDVTGKTIGWEPAEQSGFYKWIREAIEGDAPPCVKALMHENKGVEMTDPYFVAYGVGLVSASVCTNLTDQEARDRLNVEHWTGIDLPWELAEEGHFADGTPMPAACPDAADRRHLLFHC